MNKRTKIIVIASSIILLSGGAFYWNRDDGDREIDFDRKMTLVLRERDSIESGMLQSMDEIVFRLDSVRKARGFLQYGNNPENVSSKKENALQNILILNNALLSNQNKINQLEAQLNEMASANTVLRKKLATVSEKNKNTYTDITELREELDKSNEKVLSADDINKKLEKRLLEQEKRYKRLNQQYEKADQDAYTAYYITGTTQQLSSLKILENKKFPGSAAGLKITTELPEKEFEKIDARDEAIIPTHAKNPVLVSAHANDSYVWQDDEDGMKNLCITKPERFWQASKFLIVQTK